MEKNKKIKLIIFISGFIFLAVVFGFTDLQISELIANTKSKLGYFVQAYGMLPGVVEGFFAGNLLLRLTKFGGTYKKNLLSLSLLLISIAAGIGFWAMIMGQQVGKAINWWIATGAGLISVGVIQLWLKIFPDEKLKPYERPSKISILLIILSPLATVLPIKTLWGRWRYRDLLSVGNFSHFTPWYFPQGVNGHTSFISGHTAWAFCVLPLVLLFINNHKQYIAAWVIVILWGIFVAFGRVLYGAHYASDVLFSAGETLFWFWFLKKKIKNI